MRGEYIPWSEPGIRITELPPRARRIPLDIGKCCLDFRTTSACAENTGRATKHFVQPRNYLRVRGEYDIIGDIAKIGKELPPRARRILRTGVTVVALSGTTSACAENTAGPHSALTLHWNYLRVRGEYSCHVAGGFSVRELPPRARRIPSRLDDVVPCPGTTSACAENTGSPLRPQNTRGNYLRVRGEYATTETQTRFPLELPPRARRIRRASGIPARVMGTTSACAENTFDCAPGFRTYGNYLRVRGEYGWPLVAPEPEKELPPRARRIQLNKLLSLRQGGTTSACAENTGKRLELLKHDGNYLRVRGEYYVG